MTVFKIDQSRSLNICDGHQCHCTCMLYSQGVHRSNLFLDCYQGAYSVPDQKNLHFGEMCDTYKTVYMGKQSTNRWRSCNLSRRFALHKASQQQKFWCWKIRDGKARIIEFRLAGFNILLAHAFCYGTNVDNQGTNYCGKWLYGGMHWQHWATCTPRGWHWQTTKIGFCGFTVNNVCACSCLLMSYNNAVYWHMVNKHRSAAHKRSSRFVHFGHLPGHLGKRRVGSKSTEIWFGSITVDRQYIWSS